MFMQQVQLINASGLHARPASDFVKLAKSFQSKIVIKVSGRDGTVNAKSIVMILAQGISMGTWIEICAEGIDEKAAVAALSDLVASGFGEANGE